MSRVAVILVSYNHAPYLESAIKSVLKQTYSEVSLFVIDNGSSDGSPELIVNLHTLLGGFEYHLNSENIGICRAFNFGWHKVAADFYIDLSGDDFLEPDRIKMQVDMFHSLGNEFGVIYSDGFYINESNTIIGEIVKSIRYINLFPQGDIYQDLIKSYFVVAATMTIRREVLEDLQGYDESLAYEDFDFCIRSSRKWKYGFLAAKTTYIRRLPGSMSTRVYKPGDKQLQSTVQICNKIAVLNRSEAENAALANRLRYEIRHAVLACCFHEASQFQQLLTTLSKPTFADRLWQICIAIRFPFLPVRGLFTR